MSIFRKIKYKKFKEYVDIIEWTNNMSDILIWCFPRYKTEIKNGAKLIVGKSQVAVLVSDGQFADVYQPGSYMLTTANMPILATLKRWKYDFDAPFKAEVYFVNTKQFWNIHWHTENPIVMHDSEFESIRMHASGLYCFKVKPNPLKFIRNVGGADRNFSTESVPKQLFNFVTEKFKDYLTTSKITISDLFSNLNEFSSELSIALKNDYSDYGLELACFSVKEITLPENVKKVLDKRTKKNAIENSTTYTKTPFTDSVRSASSIPTGIGSLPGNHIMDREMGLTRARKMAQEMVDHQDGHPASVESDTKIKKETPPPIPHQAIYYTAIGGVQQGPFRQSQLQQMVKHGQLTPDTLVWTMGMASWQAAKFVPSLSGLFGAVPPTL